jgi:putative flippase GtrA
MFRKFALVGLLGSALQLGLIAAGIATPIAVEVAVLHNFFWHQLFTWRDRKGRIAMRLVRFHVANGAISILGNSLLMYFFVDRLKIPVVPSGLASIAICAAINFRLADRWVMR